MIMITEDYCSFEVAKLLKEKEFDGLCYCHEFTDYEGNFTTYHTEYPENWNQSEPCVSIPTLGMAMKWLREVYGLYISLEPCYDYDSMHIVFLAFVQNVADVHEFMDGRKNVASHPNAEKSYELALKYCLENLI